MGIFLTGQGHSIETVRQERHLRARVVQQVRRLGLPSHPRPAARDPQARPRPAGGPLGAGPASPLGPDDHGPECRQIFVTCRLHLNSL